MYSLIFQSKSKAKGNSHCLLQKGKKQRNGQKENPVSSDKQSQREEANLVGLRKDGLSDMC